ncbi:GATA-like domain-containing protein [Aspergillus tanneri]|uniref:Nitrogen regulatory protein areA GATA-like domain-containing protein n=1 Tax=Aspergillus tanneri TaxID=1220188 RepID=A0A5M9MA72_9EURO|nr:uncharacterized protein ATNIH1004_011284 [Aspergillus tanneri]KAA8642340.1 hypothetical protein ATNIH1004_011284 [Aspergillus tanneri]
MFMNFKLVASDLHERHARFLTPAVRYVPEESEAPNKASSELEVSTQRFNIPDQVVDDCLIEDEPSRHVDYLSHEWKEADIWASWRYMAARKKAFDKGVRLENALWRTWAKLKFNLGIVSPKTLNWLKESDVTWLYGPFKTLGTPRMSEASPLPSVLTCQPPTDRKPILKKRTLSEAIPNNPFAADFTISRPSLKAQKTDNDRNRTSFNCHKSNLGEILSQVSDVSPQTPFNGSLASTSSAGFGSPRHHVRFNNEVAQCVAVKANSDEEDESPTTFENDSSPGDGVVMTGQHITHIYSCDKNSTSRNGISSRKNTIALLPSTTLNFQGDSPEPQARSAWSRGFG